jgi:hypothetical protein
MLNDQFADLQASMPFVNGMSRASIAAVERRLAEKEPQVVTQYGLIALSMST